MQNNSKSLPQTQPSTLDIVFKNGQMNLATAIGRLEQAVTKAYGNINSSINSKQGEFNQALLKTLDQSISKSSNKMDQFYTSSFAKIYALNSAIMEQSLKKNGMVAAQRDLDGYKNYDKLFENQQRAFGDINISLKQIIEKIAPLTPEQQISETGDFAKTHVTDYRDVALYQRFTAGHNVSKVEANKSFGEIQENLFNNRGQENFDKNPLIAALTKNNSKLLEKLKNTSNISDFILLLIDNISKAYEEKNQDIIKNIPDFLKKPGILATFSDRSIRMPTEEEIKKDPNIENNNVVLRSIKSVSAEKRMYDSFMQTGASNRLNSVNDASFLVDLSARLNFYEKYTKKDDQEYLQKYRDNPSELVKNRMSDFRNTAYDKDHGDDSAFTFTKTVLPGGIGDGVVDLWKQGEKGVLGLYIHYSNSSDDINKAFQEDHKKTKETPKSLQQKPHSNLPLPIGVAPFVYKKEEENVVKQDSGQKVSVNIPEGLLSSLYQKQSSPSYVMASQYNNQISNKYSSKYSELLQNNRNLQNSYLPSITRQGVTVHNHNKFTTTINGDNRNPQSIYSNFMSTVNKQISNLTADAMNLYKTGK